MNKEIIKKLKSDIMSLLTDKNVKGVDTVGDIERFGALLAYGNAFKEVGKVFTNLEKVQNEH